MNIKILGTGCPNCKKLEANTNQALEELKVEGTIEKIMDMGEIMSYGVMGLPGLVVDDEVKVSGRIPDIEEIKTILSGHK